MISWWSSISLQDSASPLMEQLASFHDHTMIVLVGVISLVGYTMAIMMKNQFINRSLLESQAVETIWTVLPALILLVIALPSLRLLYLLDEVETPSLTVKTIGHQWYWSYEYTDFPLVEFDSYMVKEENLNEASFRLLEVDQRMVIPYKSQVRVLVTAEDVIHAWTIPALGIKADAVPGRLNQVSFTILRPGIYFGQCSEICGANHSFMPIVLESVKSDKFSSWISSF